VWFGFAKPSGNLALKRDKPLAGEVVEILPSRGAIDSNPRANGELTSMPLTARSPKLMYCVLDG